MRHVYFFKKMKKTQLLETSFYIYELKKKKTQRGRFLGQGPLLVKVGEDLFRSLLGSGKRQKGRKKIVDVVTK